MAARIQGLLRVRINASTTGRHQNVHNVSNKAVKSDIDTERMLQDCRLTVAKALASKVERMTIAHDAKINPFHWLYGSLCIPKKEFKPSSFWRLNMLFVYLFAFTTGMEAGETHAKRLRGKCRDISCSTMSEAN